ncbi:MAG: thiolase family protein [Actinobacteria bacterium]|jgi:acetyl-CoA C-acetyltransferase|nr:MAG: thiolase family protein [Actinomycetota bacterium]
MDAVAIVGVGMTQIKRERKADGYPDLVYEASRAALDDAGMSIDQVDNVITVSNDFFDGRTISSMAIQDACGSYDKNVSTVEGDGTFGAFYGLMRILSGSYGTTLVCAHHKGSESQMPLITNAMFDPIYARFLGIDAVTSSALQARAYMEKYGVTEEQCAMVSVKNHGNALKNPVAQLPLELTVEEVMSSPYISDPIKLLDCCPISDGASAVILASGDRAEKITEKAVWVKGVAHCSSAYHLGDRNLYCVCALNEAAKKAYSMAGISEPAQDIDLVELYDAFTYMEPLWLEGLGFCERGEGGNLTASGKTATGGELPVNASGGCLSGNPVLVAGLNRIIECALQVRGDAGEHQVPGVKTALAHGINGPCGQAHCVWILGGEK